jgi:pimeloyl-ACP methyl ester carboxylesterase
MIARMQTITVHFGGKSYKLSARVKGRSGKLLVFLHGWGCAKECFDGAFSYADFEDYRICALDLLGYGQSDKPQAFSYDLADQANVIALAIRSLSPTEVYLVGHSMGGGVGLLATTDLGSMLKAFINVEGNLFPKDSSTSTRKIVKQPFWLFKTVTFPTIKLLGRLNMDRSLRAWATWCHEANPLGFYMSARSLVKWSDSNKLLPLFETLPAKAYIYGDHGSRKEDVVLKLDTSITYAIPHSGHFPMLDNPDAFYATIAKIIRE